MMRSRSAGHFGLYRLGGSTRRLRTFSMTSSSFSALNSRCIVTSSQRQIPRQKMSARRSTSSPRTCSGLMYPNLPLMLPTWVRESLPAAFAMPKSMSFTSPSKDTMMFCGLTSRWTMETGLPPSSLRACA